MQGHAMSNQRDGIQVNLLEEWRTLDALPPPIRRIYTAAPYDFALANARQRLKDYHAGRLHLSDWRKLTIEEMCRTLMVKARRDYGPDHPDAVISRLAPRRAR